MSTIYIIFEFHPQAAARGYLVRRSYGHKMWAIVKIQAHVRRLIAIRRVKRLKQETKAITEALRLRSQEELRLHHQGNSRAKEIAEQNYRVSFEHIFLKLLYRKREAFTPFTLCKQVSRCN